MKRQRRASLIASGLVLLGLCVMGRSTHSAAAPGPTASASVAPTAAVSATAPQAGGHLTWVVQQTKNTNWQRLQTLLDSHAYPGPAITKMFDDQYAWPRNVVIQTRDCGVPNAAYSPSDHTVSLCYDLAFYFWEWFSKHPFQGKSTTQAVIDAMTFVQLHESAHMAIAELQTGSMGNQESDADGFATMLLLNGNAWMRQIPRVGATTMLALLNLSGPRPQYFNEHPPSQERFGDILCHVFGSDPAGNADLIAKQLVQVQRAPKCQQEFIDTKSVGDAARAAPTNEAIERDAIPPASMSRA